MSFWLVAPLVWMWGFFVIADSAQFSTLVTRAVPPHAVGTALTLQTSLGFLLTMASIQLVPVVENGRVAMGVRDARRGTCSRHRRDTPVGAGGDASIAAGRDRWLNPYCDSPYSRRSRTVRHASRQGASAGAMALAPHAIRARSDQHRLEAARLHAWAPRFPGGSCRTASPNFHQSGAPTATAPARRRSRCGAGPSSAGG